VASFLALVAVWGCGSDSGSDGSKTSGGAEKGLPAETVCAPEAADLSPAVEYEAADPQGSITVNQPRQELKAAVTPMKVTTARSIDSGGNEPVGATARKGTLLFVEFSFQNRGPGPVPSISVAELFRVRFDGKAYDQAVACRAGQAYAVKHGLSPRGKVVQKDGKGIGVAAYVVPEIGEFEWIGRTTDEMFELTPDEG
jgi:hypothetical protein